jgi:hypothetical protein
MEVKELDKAIQEIAIRRNELKKLSYSDPEYDDLEEQLHDLEDALIDAHGDYLEGVFQEIHDKYCPDTDILLPIAYLAKTYAVTSKNEFSVATTEGVYVEVDSMPGKETKLVMLPNPLRVILNVGNEKKLIVWSAK